MDLRGMGIKIYLQINLYQLGEMMRHPSKRGKRPSAASERKGNNLRKVRQKKSRRR